MQNNWRTLGEAMTAVTDPLRERHERRQLLWIALRHKRLDAKLARQPVGRSRLAGYARTQGDARR